MRHQPGKSRGTRKSRRATSKERHLPPALQITNRVERLVRKPYEQGGNQKETA